MTTPLVAQPRTEALNRVLQIKHSQSTATAFIVEVNDRQYLITAKHVVQGLLPEGVVQLLRPDNRVWMDVKIVDILDCGPNDVAVLVPSAILHPELRKLPVLTTTKGLTLGEEVHFLGYPFGHDLATPIEDGKLFLYPFIKRAGVSAVMTKGDQRIIFLDGINNPGFSGGPVVRYDHSTRASQFVGVISGYRTQKIAVQNGVVSTPLAVDTNTGIIIAYSIDVAIEAIRKKPIGPKFE